MLIYLNVVHSSVSDVAMKSFINEARGKSKYISPDASQD
jgi:hypothetical protein